MLKNYLVKTHHDFLTFLRAEIDADPIRGFKAYPVAKTSGEINR